jgi:hypothetical protein
VSTQRQVCEETIERIIEPASDTRSLFVRSPERRALRYEKW